MIRKLLNQKEKNIQDNIYQNYLKKDENYKTEIIDYMNDFFWICL